MARLLFIDTETGGLDPEKHSLLSVGFVVWDSIVGEYYSAEYYLKNENYYITKTAQKINKLTDSDFADAIIPKDLIKKFEEIKEIYFADYVSIPLAGHNTQFDVQFIRKMFKDNRRSFDNIFLHRIVDTYSILKFLQDAGIIPDKIDSSTQAFKFFDIIVDGRHTALGDAKATMQLYEKMIQLLHKK
ncbi:MAG: 3'-5' exonuclease [Clostridiales bacterium]|jgi:putative PAS/PAC sensor protein|nr:3'-5' exonuclease [Clostridiales bacterium]